MGTTDPEESTPTTTSAENPYLAMNPEQLRAEIYSLRSELNGALARKEIAEARIEFLTIDLKRHREKLIDIVGALRTLLAAAETEPGLAAKLPSRTPMEFADPSEQPTFDMSSPLRRGGLLGGLRPTRDPALRNPSHFEETTERMPASDPTQVGSDGTGRSGAEPGRQYFKGLGE